MPSALTDPQDRLLAQCERVRLAYHALSSSRSLHLVRDVVAADSKAPQIAQEWNDCIDSKGALCEWLRSTDDPEAWRGLQPLEPLLQCAPFPRLKAIGYWHSESEPGLPIPRPSPASPSLDRRDRKRVMKHLTSGLEWMSWMGFSYCRICGQNDQRMGCRDLTDGAWVWPEGLRHYVDQHELDLPPAFVEHALSRPRVHKKSFQVLCMLKAVGGFDFEPWLDWAANRNLLLNDDAPSKCRGWTVTIAGQQLGPYRDDEIRSMIQSGKIRPYHRLWKLGIGGERKARDLSRFSDLYIGYDHRQDKL